MLNALLYLYLLDFLFVNFKFDRSCTETLSLYETPSAAIITELLDNLLPSKDHDTFNHRSYETKCSLHSVAVRDVLVKANAQSIVARSQVKMEKALFSAFSISYAFDVFLQYQ